MSPEAKVIGAGLALIALIGAAAMTFDWYRCGLQQDVWARQGIHMTRSEIFMGCDPAQKAITIKDATP